MPNKIRWDAIYAWTFNIVNFMFLSFTSISIHHRKYVTSKRSVIAQGDGEGVTQWKTLIYVHRAKYYERIVHLFSDSLVEYFVVYILFPFSVIMLLYLQRFPYFKYQLKNPSDWRFFSYLPKKSMQKQ